MMTGGASNEFNMLKMEQLKAMSKKLAIDDNRIRVKINLYNNTKQ